MDLIAPPTKPEPPNTMTEAATQYVGQCIVYLADMIKYLFDKTIEKR